MLKTLPDTYVDALQLKRRKSKLSKPQTPKIKKVAYNDNYQLHMKFPILLPDQNHECGLAFWLLVFAKQEQQYELQ